MVSELRMDNILIPILTENTRRIVEIAITVYFEGFQNKPVNHGSNNYRSSILSTYLESPHQGNHCRPPI